MNSAKKQGGFHVVHVSKHWSVIIDWYNHLISTNNCDLIKEQKTPQYYFSIIQENTQFHLFNFFSFRKYLLYLFKSEN